MSVDSYARNTDRLHSAKVLNRIQNRLRNQQLARLARLNSPDPLGLYIGGSLDRYDADELLWIFFCRDTSRKPAPGHRSLASGRCITVPQFAPQEIGTRTDGFQIRPPAPRGPESPVNTAVVPPSRTKEPNVGTEWLTITEVTMSPATFDGNLGFKRLRNNWATTEDHE